MKVLLLSPLPPPVGGIATWTKQVLDTARGASDLEIDHIDTSIRWRSLTQTNVLSRVIGGGIHAVIQGAMILKRALLNRPHVVHICSAAEFGLARDAMYLACLTILNVRTVLHLHRGKVPDFPELVNRMSWESCFLRLAVRLASTTLVLNRGALEALEKFAPRRVRVLPNMIEMAATQFEQLGRSEPNDKPYVVTFVGHVIARKGIHDLVQAIGSIVHKHRDLELRVIGPCAEQTQRELEALAMTQSGSSQWLRVCGTKDAKEVREALLETTLFCLPSYAEGFPYVILEAMACGVSIVSSPVGAIPEAIGEGGGVLVSPGDVAQLGAAIDGLLRDASRRSSMGRYNYERCAEHFSTSAVFAALVETWTVASSALPAYNKA